MYLNRYKKNIYLFDAILKDYLCQRQKLWLVSEVSTQMNTCQYSFVWATDISTEMPRNALEKYMYSNVEFICLHYCLPNNELQLVSNSIKTVRGTYTLNTTRKSVECFPPCTYIFLCEQTGDSQITCKRTRQNSQHVEQKLKSITLCLRLVISYAFTASHNLLWKKLVLNLQKS